jgi:hypothetical protein
MWHMLWLSRMTGLSPPRMPLVLQSPSNVVSAVPHMGAYAAGKTIGIDPASEKERILAMREEKVVSPLCLHSLGMYHCG